MDDSTTGADGIQDMDSILNDYESKTQPKQSAPEGWDKVVSFIDEARAEKEARLAEETRVEIESAYKPMAEEYGIDEDLAHGFLLAQADRNPDIAKAFESRKSDPAGWQKALESVKGKLAEKMQNIDRKATDDTNQMVAALTGSNKTKSKSDEAPKYEKMSDAEFNKAVSDLL